MLNDLHNQVYNTRLIEKHILHTKGQEYGFSIVGNGSGVCWSHTLGEIAAQTNAL